MTRDRESGTISFFKKNAVTPHTFGLTDECEKIGDNQNEQYECFEIGEDTQQTHHKLGKMTVNFFAQHEQRTSQT